MGLALGWRPSLIGIAYAVLWLILGTWAFVALALLLAGAVRAEGVLAIANLVWVLLLVLGGVIVPRASVSGVGGTLMGWLPSAALADGLRGALVDGALLWPAVGVLVVWAVAATALARRTFRWSD